MPRQALGAGSFFLCFDACPIRRGKVHTAQEYEFPPGFARQMLLLTQLRYSQRQRIYPVVRGITVPRSSTLL